MRECLLASHKGIVASSSLIIRALLATVALSHAIKHSLIYQPTSGIFLNFILVYRLSVDILTLILSFFFNFSGKNTIKVPKTRLFGSHPSQPKKKSALSKKKSSVVLGLQIISGSMRKNSEKSSSFCASSQTST
jgi:hypothetical protein